MGRRAAGDTLFYLLLAWFWYYAWLIEVTGNETFFGDYWE